MKQGINVLGIRIHAAGVVGLIDEPWNGRTDGLGGKRALALARKH